MKRNLTEIRRLIIVLCIGMLFGAASCSQDLTVDPDVTENVAKKRKITGHVGS